MLCSDDQILHATAFCQVDYGIGVEINRVEGLCQMFVFLVGNLELGLDPLRITARRLPLVFPSEEGRETPVDHNSILDLACLNHSAVSLIIYLCFC